MEDEEYKKLPLEERCVHKLWKARAEAYEELAKLFRQLDDDKSPEFAKYTSLVKKMVVDANAMGQEKGLEAALAYAENYANAGKTAPDVMAGVVSKGLAAPRTRTKDLALQLTLMYVEIEKGEVVEEELIKGMEQKNPKIVAACVNAATTALHEFGSAVINLKPLVKKIGVLFGDRDKTVRDEARKMVIEMYRWIGPALRSQLGSLQQVQMAELEAEFTKIDGTRPTATRLLKSQQNKKVQMGSDGVDGDNEGDDDGDEDDPSAIPTVDPYDLAEPVDVLSKVPKDFYERIEAKKWQERKEAIEQVEALLKGAAKLENGDYGDLVRALKKAVQKDSNVLVVALACKCIALLASGLKRRFQPYSSAIVGPLLEKFKEKKQNVVVVLKEAADAVYLTTNLEAIMEDVSEALASKNPSVKTETACFLSRAFTKTSPTVMNKKLIKTVTTALLKNINESDPNVRDASAEAIGTLMKLVGEKVIGSYLLELEKDNLKMSKIKECCEKAVVMTVKVNGGGKKERPATAPVKAGAGKSTGAKKVSGCVTKSASVDVLDPMNENGARDDAASCGDAAAQSQVQHVDISNQLSESLFTELSDKNWKVRNEALTKISTILAEAKFVKPNLGDLPQMLALRLTDSNSKIAQSAVGVCETLAVAVGPPFKQHVRTLFPGLLQGLGDSKTWIRSASLTAINSIGDVCGYNAFFEGEMVGDALKTGSPALRIELWAWLADKLPKTKSIPKEELLVCIPYLYANLEDRNVDVRKNAQEAVLGIMIHIGYEPMSKQVEKLKPASKAAVVAALDKARPNLPVKALPKKQAAEKEKSAVKNAGKGPKKAAGASVAKQSSSGANRNKKDDDTADSSPLLVANNAKYQRTLDEAKLKVLKWNFTTPREEFVELLKEQMTNANINRNLIAQMFHSDFRYHIRALESLAEDLPDNSQALIANLDLILKWLTLRFFDTNPSVLLKGLEYLHSVFNILIENQYTLIENEASSFIPYLILKIGDPKDSVRNGVRSLLRQICDIYSVSKLLTHVMDGLKSKNARQRAECLEVMGTIIEDHGLNVCLPSPASCLKEVARQISDRDNSVRQAALNCVVQAYYEVGDKVYKMVGQIPDKDMSLLEERVKRAATRRPQVQSAKRSELVLAQNEPAVAVNPDNLQNDDRTADEEGDRYEQDEEEEEDNIPQVQVTCPAPAIAAHYQERIAATNTKDEFILDPDFIKYLDSMDCKVPKLELPHINLDFLSHEVSIPSLEKTDVTPITPPKPIIPNQIFRNRPNVGIVSGDDYLVFIRLLREVTSADLGMSLKAVSQLQEFLRDSTKWQLISENEDQFMIAVIKQLKTLYPMDVSNTIVCRVYRAILTAIDAFYNCGGTDAGKRVSQGALKDILLELIRLLAESKLDKCPNGDSYVRVVNLHCVKIIEKSDHTNVICALIRLLRETVAAQNSTPSTSQPRIVELVMKCLWRVIKIMPSWHSSSSSGGLPMGYDSILYEVHMFLRDFPTTWWKTKPSDTPLRTIKTMLHSVTKAKGSAILLHLGKIDDLNESEVENYILRLLKSMKLEEAKPSNKTTSEMSALLPGQQQMTKTLSRANHAKLTDIFQKIGNKDVTKEGLVLLYDFIRQHPEADIEPFLTKSSQFFQEYIRQGLNEIEEERKKNNKTSMQEKIKEKVLESTSTPHINEKQVMGPEYWKERLNMWNRIWEETKTAGGNSSDN